MANQHTGTELQWNSPETLRALLCELVNWESRTTTEGEKAFPHRLAEKLKSVPYFEAHPEQLELHDAGLGRNSVTALYKNHEAQDTIVLISHFDTVWTEEYGALEPFAFHPEELTAKLHEYKEELPEEALADLESGEYLFGRGTMDMKMGLALHMSLIEKAASEQWPLNLVLLAVPDEEVSSAGMRTAVKSLVRIKQEHDLTYTLFLNGEPVFSQEPGDPREYIYSGTIGKIMPAALFYGKETHVGEPLKGITSTFMASFLTQRMEWNNIFEETDHGETTPLPVTLQQKDLKAHYSVQTPYRSTALYNVFTMRRTAAEVMELFEGIAKDSVQACETTYSEICEREGVPKVGEIKLLKFEELMDYANNKLGEAEVKRIITEVSGDWELDDRDKSFKIVDVLMIECQELAPATVLLFAPPYYPAVNTSDDALVQELVTLMQDKASSLGTEVSQIHYFNGISDLSYVHYEDEGTGWKSFERNTPVWGSTYWMPFEEMKALDAPVLNVGPFGKDAHQRTERLHIESAFVRLPQMLETLAKHFCGK
ncbi:M20/M25/M40 family metallo-hydrolase [Sporosarcina sp. D27]|uniref:M20/M25/M40 family metallo-hydrolase n=1 Tax=Sporosarcina sp. D27 TaxID=1382305 RepID=UPI00046EBFF2|nr:M20/M25/M40 family metallo-hydrolase [Sporosarcina sp. D27]